MQFMQNNETPNPGKQEYISIYVDSQAALVKI